MSDLDKAWFRYLPVTPEARRWGMYILDSGFTLIPPNTPYPPGKHPEDHHFSWSKGRVLQSFTLVYITRGQGDFESKSSGLLKIREGDMFIVFPDEWHRYRPDASTGWDEYWVEFDGEQACRIMRSPGFSRKRPVIHIGHDEKMLSLFLDITRHIESSVEKFEHIIAAQASQIVAMMLAASQRDDGAGAKNREMVQKACCLILEKSDEVIDFNRMASEFGLSISAFRKRFKQICGLPPGKYQNQIRINKARDMLYRTDFPINEIADRLGFESVYYFSRLFKLKTGISPSEYRKIHCS